MLQVRQCPVFRSYALVIFHLSAGNLDVKYEPQDTADSLMSGDESSEAGDDASVGLRKIKYLL